MVSGRLGTAPAGGTCLSRAAAPLNLGPGDSAHHHWPLSNSASAASMSTSRGISATARSWLFWSFARAVPTAASGAFGE